MELTKRVARNVWMLVLCFIVSCGFSSFSQIPKPATTPENIDLFPKPGFEPLELHKSRVRDNSNFKPENFQFPQASGKSLNDRLEVGVSAETVDCKPSWGLFKFRVNSKGQIDSTWFDGHLPKKVSMQILKNIRATQGSWIIAPGTKESDVAWYVYFYSDTRARLTKNLNCSESDKELQRAVSSMSSYFYNMYYWVGEDKAMIIRPTSNDGAPRN
nr:hypothetical protein [uncultured Dyadobacter sp.]